MTEPSWIATFVATAGGITLTLLGVDYYALVWAFIGAAVALSFTKPLQPSSVRVRIPVFVVLSTLIGAALGDGGAHLIATAGAHPNRILVIVGSLVCGAGAQKIIAAAITAIESRISRLGGGQ